MKPPLKKIGIVLFFILIIGLIIFSFILGLSKIDSCALICIIGFTFFALLVHLGAYKYNDTQIKKSDKKHQELQAPYNLLQSKYTEFCENKISIFFVEYKKINFYTNIQPDNSISVENKKKQLNSLSILTIKSINEEKDRYLLGEVDGYPEWCPMPDVVRKYEQNITDIATKYKNIVSNMLY